MKKFIQHIILFLIPFIVGAVYLFSIPFYRQFAYHFVKGECDDKGSWIYNRIYENKKPADVVLCGASHIANGVDDKLFELQLDSANNLNLSVANIGYCRGGRDIQYVMLKDLFLNKNPQLLILDVGEDEPKKSHPVFPYLAETPDLFGSAIFFNQRFFKSVAKGLATRFEMVKTSVFKWEFRSSPNLSDFGYIGSTQVVSAADMDENLNRWEKQRRRKKPTLLRNIELRYSKHYVRKIVNLAETHNCQVVFLYFPESGSKLKFPMLKDFYEQMGPLYIIPEKILTDSNNWKDPSHLNDAGSSLTTKWLTKQMIADGCFEK